MLNGDAPKPKSDAPADGLNFAIDQLGGRIGKTRVGWRPTVLKNGDKVLFTTYSVSRLSLISVIRSEDYKTLENLRDRLGAIFAADDGAMLEDSTAQAGQAVICKWLGDGHHYRSEILDVNRDKMMARVLLVDVNVVVDEPLESLVLLPQELIQCAPRLAVEVQLVSCGKKIFLLLVRHVLRNLIAFVHFFSAEGGPQCGLKKKRPRERPADSA